MTKTELRHSASGTQIKVTPDRVLELRKKILDENYMDSAIQRIAQVISNRLVDNSVQRFVRG
ncbi:MAG: hypothetical protein K6A89_11030 [Treponema sp.]|nr:hypothetical protein [Treponema sp.]